MSDQQAAEKRMDESQENPAATASPEADGGVEEEVPEVEIPQASFAEEPETQTEVAPEVEQEMLADVARMDAEDQDANGEPIADAEAELSVSQIVGEAGRTGKDDPVPTVKQVQFGDLERKSPGGQTRNIEILMEVKLPIAIELGHTTMAVRDILDLGPGSVVELDKLAGEPVDLLVNNKVIAKGEVVVVDENFGIRVTSLLSPEERLKSL